ncbi:hypothetical protein LCGC14_0836750 [marine sediment metagenome]|uniref:Uncharacterized protein n=1 Tax=marine sediment metagenome TaxID=412755 RepID=A0A0F9RZ14_9ZZZZ
MSFGFKSPIVVSSILQTVGTSVVTRVPSSTSNQTLIASNGDRRGLLIYNDSIADQYIKLGTVATTIDFTVKLTRRMFYEVTPAYVGQIDVISSSTNGAIQVTELT